MTLTAPLTLPELARMMQAAIRNRDYQSETRLGNAVRDYLAWKRLRASARTIVIYEGYLARLCLTLAHDDPAVDGVTPQMLLEALSEYPRGSLRIVRTTYSDFFRWASRWGRCDRNPVDLLPGIPEPPMRVYNVFTALEQSKLVAVADKLPMPTVQRLRVLCLLELGIRRGEARGLRVEHFDRVSRTVVVSGKGEKERMVPFGDELDRALFAFLNRPVPKVRRQDGAKWFLEDRRPRDDDHILFPCGVTAEGSVRWTNPAKQLSDRATAYWWQRQIVATAGVKYRSMHMARHTLGTDLSSAGEDLANVQDWLGHASPETTKIYVHNSRARLRGARVRLDEYRKAQGE